MIEFVEECRQEWKRLGVPDPIANEMAADLTADIEEAEAEGGSAEDVLGTSLFDPRRFAAAWAGARGVTAPPNPVGPVGPPAPRLPERRPWYRPVTIVALAGVGFVMALAAVAVVLGRQGSAVAARCAGSRRHRDRPDSDRARPRRSPSVSRVSGLDRRCCGPAGAIVALALLLVGLVVLGAGRSCTGPRWSPPDDA